MVTSLAVGEGFNLALKCLPVSSSHAQLPGSRNGAAPAAGEGGFVQKGSVMAPVEALLSHHVSGETDKQESWRKEQSGKWLKGRRGPFPGI